jgi:hypothetical protein
MEMECAREEETMRKMSALIAGGLLLTTILASPAFATDVREVSTINKLYAVANGLAAVRHQLDGMVIHLTLPPNPIFPPSPIGPVNQLGAMVTQLDLLDARIQAGYPDPGPPTSPELIAALSAVRADAQAIVEYPDPGPPSDTESNIEFLQAFFAVRTAAQAIVDLVSQVRPGS